MNDARSTAPHGKPQARVVFCPTCGESVRWTLDHLFRPFCSERCKLIDLGQWAAEQYRIPLESDADGADAEVSPTGS